MKQKKGSLDKAPHMSERQYLIFVRNGITEAVNKAVKRLGGDEFDQETVLKQVINHFCSDLGEVERQKLKGSHKSYILSIIPSIYLDILADKKPFLDLVKIENKKALTRLLEMAKSIASSKVKKFRDLPLELVDDIASNTVMVFIKAVQHGKVMEISWKSYLDSIVDNQTKDIAQRELKYRNKTTIHKVSLDEQTNLLAEDKAEDFAWFGNRLEEEYIKEDTLNKIMELMWNLTSSFSTKRKLLLQLVVAPLFFPMVKQKKYTMEEKLKLTGYKSASALSTAKNKMMAEFRQNTELIRLYATFKNPSA
jgi:hypothetical protein